MTTPSHPKELIALVADLDAENALRGILSRHEALRICPLPLTMVDIHRHVCRDSGCYSGAHDFLRPFVAAYRHALVLFDHHGSGHEHRPACEIESDVEDRLTHSGWKNRCAVVVPAPELEIWVWSDSPNVADELGWAGKQPPLREWLVAQQLAEAPGRKPRDPKEALRRALRQQRQALSARLFRNLAERVGFRRCQDRAFAKLRETLLSWFPQREDRPADR